MADMKVTVETEEEKVWIDNRELDAVYRKWEKDFGEDGADKIWESLNEIGIVLEW